VAAVHISRTRLLGRRISRMIDAMVRQLPTGTVTFLFTDVEGSTRLLHEVGADAFAGALSDHRRVLRAAFERHGGVEVDTQGDSFFVAFPTAPGAVAAAAEGQALLEGGPIRVRMGIHTGTPLVTDEGYVGPDVHRAARIAAAGSGRQVLLSRATRDLVDAEVRDLGEHRLKDLSAPERIFQLGSGTFPRLKTLHQTNLPIPATQFLGRSRELAEVLELLARADVRLLTLTGAGGMGKTRLALAAAGVSAGAYPDGVWWVPLASLRDPALVLDQTRQALGLQGDVAEQLTDKRLLILFDNFEHVLAATSGLGDVLGLCPNVRMLVTSREPLRLAGEREYMVPPLSEEDAVDLFSERAVEAAQAETALAICRRLDCLPLAMELAAARTRVLSPLQILERLEQRLPLLGGGPRDAPERQRTLQATIDWSHDLLTRDEQRLFARLAVFVGGCTLDAAEEVANADLDTLQSLVEKNLLRHTGERFWMLETIREYALERLRAYGEEERAQERHGGYYRRFAESARLEVIEAVDHLDWLPRLQAEHDNFRAALVWAHATGQNQLEVRLILALADFWVLRGHWVEGRQWVSRALVSTALTSRQRAAALSAAGSFASKQGDSTAAIAYAEEQLALAHETGDGRETSVALNRLGVAMVYASDFAAARGWFEESRDVARQAGANSIVGRSTVNLGWIALHDGDLDAAAALFAEAVEIARPAQQPLLATAIGSRGVAFRRSGRVTESAADIAEALELAHKLGLSEDLADLIREVAAHATLRGRPREAARLIGAEARLRAELGSIQSKFEQDASAFPLELLKATLSDNELGAEIEAGQAMQLEAAIAAAAALVRPTSEGTPAPAEDHA
jgi:predicted ATPase/class 3 adenylate cyclase